MLPHLFEGVMPFFIFYDIIVNYSKKGDKILGL